jgi:NADPH:quinone reductase-like Zn-dependent oxidoreductase
MECAGVVDALGEGVGRWVLGDAVMGIVGGGGYAEALVTHEDVLVRVPEGMSVADAGAIPEVFMTAFDAAWLQMGLLEGETVLIHAVGSGVGTAAVQMAAAFGCRSLGTSRTPSKLERAVELGLDHAVLAQGDSSWPQQVLDLTEGRGVDVILDLVGGAYLAGNQRVMAHRGRHVIVGVPSGQEASFDLRLLMAKRGEIRGTVLRARPTEEKAALARAFEQRVLPLFDRGRLRPVIDRVLRPEDAPESHRLLEANATFGKVLLSWE